MLQIFILYYKYGPCHFKSAFGINFWLLLIKRRRIFNNEKNSLKIYWPLYLKKKVILQGVGVFFMVEKNFEKPETLPLCPSFNGELGVMLKSKQCEIERGCPDYISSVVEVSSCSIPNTCCLKVSSEIEIGHNLMFWVLSQFVFLSFES